ncbi:hypothetical protein BB558_007238, partial [Smittium angustum]
NLNNTGLEIRNLVPRPGTVINQSTIIDTVNVGYSGPKKRKIAAIEEQELETHGLESELSALKAQGLSDLVIKLILENNRAVKRKSRYHGSQKEFLNWRITNGQPNPITADQIVNFLADIYVKRQLKPSSIIAYKSAIMNLVPNQNEIINQSEFKEFFKAMTETTITSFVHSTINISPVVKKLKEWGPLADLDNAKLTTKLCWLLSDPKKKRKGSPIEKPCEIKKHLDLVLCPVEAYKIYISKIANVPCITEHENNKSISYNSLMRYTKNNYLALTVDRKPIPKGRAIGATLASAAGISADTIVSHGFWARTLYLILITDCLVAHRKI